MRRIMIRYKVKPDQAKLNEELVRAVYDELHRTQPDGFHYASFRLDDGVSFVHVAVLDGEENPLTTSAAFGEFQSGLKERVVEGPVPADATVVGSYRLLPE